MPTLKDFGIKYQKELRNNPTAEKALEIAEKINKLHYKDGKSLSDDDKNNIISYIEELPIDPKTGLYLITDSDNTEFLKLVAIIKNNIKGV